MKRILTLVALAVLAAPRLAVSAESVVQEASGEAAIVGGDRAMAKEKAKEAALREAVSRALGTMISSDTLVENSQLVNDRILSHAAGYVRKWSLLSEKMEGEGDAAVMVVTVRADVAQGKLDKDLEAVKTLIASRKKPRLILMIAEQSVGQVAPKGWWSAGAGPQGPLTGQLSLSVVETALHDKLEKDGWVIVDAQAASGKIKVKGALSTDLSQGDAKEIGNLAGAEVAIYGQVVAYPTELGEGIIPKGSMFPVQLNGTASAVNCDTGEILAREQISFMVPPAKVSRVSAEDSAMTGLRMAGEQLADRLRAKIYERWRKEATGETRVVLDVSGVPDYSALMAFKSLLTSGVRGVKEVAQRRMEGGRATLDLSLAGSTETLAAELSAKVFKGLTVKVTKVTPNSMEVVLGK